MSRTVVPMTSRPKSQARSTIRLPRCMRLQKLQALVNDYMIVEQSDVTFELTAARIEKICKYHFGAGADGILLISESEDPEIVANVRIFNPDGSEAELSGNGVRE